MRELLNLDQVKTMLGVSDRTVFRYIKKGDLKGFKMGKEWRFESSDIDNFILRRRQVTEQALQDKTAQPC
jgi:excisionase family DNA binding protein